MPWNFVTIFPILSHITPLCLICLHPCLWLSISLAISQTQAPSLIFSLPSHLSSTTWWIPPSPSLSPSLYCFHPNSHLLPLPLIFLCYFMTRPPAPALYLAHFLLYLQARSHRDQREEEAKLTPTHISSLHFFFPTRAAKSKSVFL